MTSWVLLFIVLAGVSAAVYANRAQLTALWPGLKTKIWNGGVAIVSAIAALLDQLKALDLSALFTGPNAGQNVAKIALTLAVAGRLIGVVTKRAED